MAESMRFVGPLERALYLKTSAPLEGVDSATIAALAEIGRERSLRKGARIARAGEPVTSVHLVVEGSIELIGAQNPGAILVGPRETVGLLSVLTRAQDGIQATAVEDSLTLEFDGEAWLDLVEENLDFLLALIRWLARRTLAERREIPAGSYLAPYADYPPVHPEGPDLVERVLRMRRRGSTFERTSVEGIVDLARRVLEVRFPAGTTIWNAGDRSRSSFIILSGTVLCTTQGERVPFRCGPGYPLGNLERLCGEPRWYTAVAETDVVAFESDMDTFLDVIEDHPDMGRELLAAMASNLIRLLRERAEAETPPRNPPASPHNRGA